MPDYDFFHDPLNAVMNLATSEWLKKTNDYDWYD